MVDSKTLYYLLIAGACTMLVTAFAGRTDSAKAGKISPDSFSFEKRLQIFTEIDRQANELWHSPKTKILKKAGSATFTSLPLLLLFDRNNDNQPEEFAYVKSENNQETQEFGFFFDLDGNGSADYIVYNGGPLFSKDFSKMYWMNYHWIDSNNDGKIDTYVFNAVNSSGAAFYDEGLSAWIYDRNGDGLFDEAEYLGKDVQQTIEKISGAFIIKTSLGERSWKENEDMSFKNTMLAEINKLK
ncbi:MAG TPA: hypothetical protein VFQ73_03190 [Flavisolibacter sp.]|nr:hypothetical protein [Flavisolibacter sp.]